MQQINIVISVYKILKNTDPGIRGSIPSATRFFLEAVGLEWGPLSLVSITEELLE
jgi:hypothetical protein